MYLKIKYIALLCVLVIALAVGCSKEEVLYDFPLEREVVEQVISDQQLTWRIEDEQSFYDGHLVFSLRDDDNVFCAISSYADEGKKHLGLTFHFPLNYTSKQIQQFNKEEWSNLFTIVGTFYGNSKDMKKVYNDFLTYVNNRNSTEYKFGYFTKRIGDTHFKAKFSPFENDMNFYQLNALEIMNSETYEKNASAKAEGWTNAAKVRGTKVLANIGVSDIKEISTEDDVLRLIVPGHLENIRKLKDTPETLKALTTYRSYTPHKDDYFTAKLVDDTGSIDVFVLSTSLNSTELGQIRNHHIDYFSKEKLGLIILSPLSE
ncbi:hypothetical protein R9X47_10275 [Wukongibacter baidiensis]|uniref:hypothetical protein n=1 Tax=Wukongibacter baidiensis TaxID=1723361 RepID=UPI003D7F70EB